MWFYALNEVSEQDSSEGRWKENLCGTIMEMNPSTHRAAIPQWPPHFLPASVNSDKPMRLIVGAIARGPIYLSTRPRSPERPRTIWSNEATRMAPWIYGWQSKRGRMSVQNVSLWSYCVCAFSLGCFLFDIIHMGLRNYFILIKFPLFSLIFT